MNKSYRYEKKFIIENDFINNIENIINLSKLNFSQHYNARRVNNIYLDTINLENYFDNIEGNNNRKKLRIRWYGDLFGNIKNPKIELKNKHSEVGYKSIRDFRSFNFNDIFDLNTLLNKTIYQDYFNNLDFKSYLPVLLNTYERKYFISFDKKIRLTLDKNLKFYSLLDKNNSFLDCRQLEDTKIMELKYDIQINKIVDSLTNYLPFRIKKFSKYVHGVSIFREDKRFID